MVDQRRDLSGTQVMAMLDEMADAIEDFRHGALVMAYDDTGHPKPNRERTPNVARLLELMRAATRDGYRTSSRPGGAPASVLDERGDPMPPLSDPTGELATADSRIIDPIRYNGESVFRGLGGALGDLRMARAALVKLAQTLTTDPGEPGCAVHSRIGSWEAVHKNGRCRWCYDFWLAEGQDPPTDLLDARAAGRRITRQMVEDALRKPKKGNRRRVPVGAA